MDKTPLRSNSTERPDVSVMIVNYNTGHLLGRMFEALEASRGSLRLQVIVVDNASRDNSVELLRSQYPNVELIENPTNVGFGRANNQALPLVRGRYVLLLNTDAFVSADTLVKTIDFMDKNPRCGVLGVKLIGPDGLLQPSCRYFPTPWNVFLASTGLSRFFPHTRLVDNMSWDHASVRECDWVPGCYYLVRREVIDQVGLFDHRYFLYYEEVDHCRSVRRAGWSVVYYPFTHVVHMGGEGAKSDSEIDSGRQISTLNIESEFLYFRKHHGIIGVLAWVMLAILSDIMKVLSGLLRYRNMKRASASIGHFYNVIRASLVTKLGAQAKR